jgi:hypothetical protein
MGLDAKISDGEGSKRKVGVENSTRYGNGLKVYTYTGQPTENDGAFYVNETYGADMNQDASVGGSPEKIHDGIDSALYTAAALTGTWTFNSTAQAHAGTNSIDATATTNNDEAQLVKGANVTLANFVSFSGWIYLTGFDTRGTKHIQLYGWDTGTGLQVGNTINIDNYIDTTTFGSWQQFTIPFADFAFGSPTLDAVRFKTIDVGPGPPPNYYLDDLQWEQTGGSIIYAIEPDNSDVWEVNNIHFNFADALASTLTDGTMPNIPYNTLLGVSALSNGIVIRRTQDGEVTFNANIKHFMDLITLPSEKTILSGSDGTNTWLRVEIKFPTPFTLDGKHGDKLEIILSDDLSGLLFMRVTSNYALRVEKI